MSCDLVPVTPAAGDVGTMALALAAARIALEERAKAASAPITLEQVEEAAEKAVREAFERLGVDLTKPESVDKFRETIGHARKVQGWIDKAGTTVWTGVWMAITATVVAAFSRYGIGGGK